MRAKTPWSISGTCPNGSISVLVLVNVRGRMRLVAAHSNLDGDVTNLARNISVERVHFGNYIGFSGGEVFHLPRNFRARLLCGGEERVVHAPGLFPGLHRRGSVRIVVDDYVRRQ